MDSNTDAQQSPAPIETDGHKRKQQQRMKVPMWFVVPVQSRVEKVESIALYDPDFRCCMMPKTFLERHNCLDKMKPNPATHDSNCGPHQRIGTFQCRFRPVGKPGKTYVATFCVIEDNKGEVQPIFVGQGTSEPRSLANALTSESTQEDEKSAGPILPGPKPKGLQRDLPSSKFSRLTESRGLKS